MCVDKFQQVRRIPLYGMHIDFVGFLGIAPAYLWGRGRVLLCLFVYISYIQLFCWRTVNWIQAPRQCTLVRCTIVSNAAVIGTV